MCTCSRLFFQLSGNYSCHQDLLSVYHIAQSCQVLWFEEDLMEVLCVCSPTFYSDSP